MNRGNLPNTPEAVLAHLLPFLLFAHKVFEVAVPEATLDEFVSKGVEEIEGCHHSSAIRIRVRRGLSDKPPDLEYLMRDLTNNGLEIFYKEHTIKFFKGVNGQPPPCGKSDTRKAFYQQSLFGVLHESFLARNLLVIYNVAKDGTFLGLDLACPKGVVSDYAPPELHWSVPVPHPATIQGSEAEYEQLPDDLDIKRDDEDEGDLGISLDGTDDE